LVGVVLLKTVKSFTLGLYMSLSCLALFGVTLYQDTRVWKSSKTEGLGSLEDTVFRISQLLLLIFTILAGMALPRRPDVYKDGVQVDVSPTLSHLDSRQIDSRKTGFKSAFVFLDVGPDESDS
jgi:hypothetical protein